MVLDKTELLFQRFKEHPSFHSKIVKNHIRKTY